jgi:riboflavin synthase
MFTGLISDVGEVLAIEPRGALRRVRIACSYLAETIAEGASIACGGPCLTAVAIGTVGDRSWFEIDVAAETLARTNAREWKVGTKLNLERSLKIGDELGGHIVSIDAFDGMKRYTIEAPPELARFIAEKGSVSLDGTSLTVNEVEGRMFSILLIPHTLAVTTWGERRAGEDVNIEVDLMARYAARLVEAK